MTIINDQGKEFMVKPHEQMTIYHAVELKSQIISCIDQNRHVALDLSGVSEIDTAGLQVLILAQRHALQCGTSLRLESSSLMVKDILEFCHLSTLFSNNKSLQEGGHGCIA